MICTGCSEEFTDEALSCPKCQRLVYAPELERLAAVASQAADAKQWSAAIDAWRSALSLLPSETRQHQIVLDKIEQLEASQQAAEKEKSGIIVYLMEM